MKPLFQTKFAQLEAAGFLFQSDIINSKEQIEGSILTCKVKGSVFYGECVDLYLNGEVVQHHTIPGKKPLFKFGNF